MRALCASPGEYGVSVSRNRKGALIVDAGIDAKGGFEAGRLITEICMGGLGRAQLSVQTYGDTCFSAISVFTDHRAVAALGSQLAGWKLRTKDFSAICSGPGRALALRPPHVLEQIHYADKADTAVLVMETTKKPSATLISQLSRECHVSPSRTSVTLVPTASLAGAVQISGRVVEAGLHKLARLGLDPLSVDCAWGWAPIAPVHPQSGSAMGRTNDAILYGGVACYVLRHQDNEALKALLREAPASASQLYGRPLKEIFERAGADFYKVDPDLFAPAVFWVNNLVYGSAFRTGEVRLDLLASSWGLTS